ncbi:MAG: hypothetical protein M8354_06465 [Halalkalicoccus sp.]|nr:hypothetical protein [Halalkalicoccus sp.]
MSDRLTPPDDHDGIDPSAFEDLPSTDVTVDTHVHFGMTGSFPLRLAELFFADDGVYIAEYGYIMPLFGLGTRKHHREAAAMRRVYEVHGLGEVLLQADRVIWHSYENLHRVVLYDGGRLGRTKITVYPEEGTSHAYRLHDEVQFVELTPEIERCGERYGFPVEANAGIGVRPRASLGRFWNR